MTLDALISGPGAAPAAGDAAVPAALVIVIVVLAPVVLALVRHRRGALIAATTVVALVPLALPPSQTILRFALLIFTWCMAIKVAQYLTGDERPRTFADFVQFLTVLAVADWRAPRTPDARLALRSVATGATQLALFAAVTLALRALPLQSMILEVIAIAVLLYLALAGATNLLVALLRARGIPHVAPFCSPLLARSPAEFWSRRWNTWASHVFHRYAFLPSGGLRHPIRGSFAAFGASGLLHEGLVLGSTLRPSGLMLAFYGLQGVAAIAGSRSRRFRRLIRKAPAAASILTLAFMLASGWMFVAAMRPVLAP